MEPLCPCFLLTEPIRVQHLLLVGYFLLSHNGTDFLDWGDTLEITVINNMVDNGYVNVPVTLEKTLTCLARAFIGMESAKKAPPSRMGKILQ